MARSERLTKTTGARVSGATFDEADRYIREDECLHITSLSRTTRWRLERDNKFPRRRILSNNAVGWLLSEVLAWRSNRPTRPEAYVPLSSRAAP
jgi:predicted DNA-binding transcriptional regulator AlpA